MCPPSIYEHYEQTDIMFLLLVTFTHTIFVCTIIISLSHAMAVAADAFNSYMFLWNWFHLLLCFADPYSNATTERDDATIILREKKKKFEI
jgi:hypothetical protein